MFLEFSQPESVNTKSNTKRRRKSEMFWFWFHSLRPRYFPLSSLELVCGFIMNFPVFLSSAHAAPDGQNSGILCMHLLTGKSCWILQAAVQYACI